MYRPAALLPASLLIAVVALAAAPAAAQYYGQTTRTYGYDQGFGNGYGYGDADRYGTSYRDSYDRYGRGPVVPATAGWRSQLDRPGDYRCDAYWDANRTDCGAPWRDQRRSYGYGYGYSSGYGYSAYGHTDPYYDRTTAYGGSRYGYSSSRRGYGQAPRGHDGPDVWPAAYGRPDLVYPDAGNRGGRNARRVDWCRANYRSYDPGSGYYRAYSGRLVYCG